jgi:hypothetical protein
VDAAGGDERERLVASATHTRQFVDIVARGGTGAAALDPTEGSMRESLQALLQRVLASAPTLSVDGDETRPEADGMNVFFGRHFDTAVMCVKFQLISCASQPALVLPLTINHIQGAAGCCMAGASDASTLLAAEAAGALAARFSSMSEDEWGGLHRALWEGFFVHKCAPVNHLRSLGVQESTGALLDERREVEGRPERDEGGVERSRATDEERVGVLSLGLYHYGPPNGWRMVPGTFSADGGGLSPADRVESLESLLIRPLMHQQEGEEVEDKGQGREEATSIPLSSSAASTTTHWMMRSLCSRDIDVVVDMAHADIWHYRCAAFNFSIQHP